MFFDCQKCQHLDGVVKHLMSKPEEQSSNLQKPCKCWVVIVVHLGYQPQKGSQNKLANGERWLWLREPASVTEVEGRSQMSVGIIFWLPHQCTSTHMSSSHADYIHTDRVSASLSCYWLTQKGISVETACLPRLSVLGKRFKEGETCHSLQFATISFPSSSGPLYKWSQTALPLAHPSASLAVRIPP